MGEGGQGSEKPGVLSLPHPAAAGLPGAREGKGACAVAGRQQEAGKVGMGVGRGLCPANRRAEAVRAEVTYPTGPHLL